MGLTTSNENMKNTYLVISIIIILTLSIILINQNRSLKTINAKIDALENSNQNDILFEFEQHKSSLLNLVLTNNYEAAISLIDSLNPNDTSSELSQTKKNILAFINEFDQQIELSQQNRLLYGQIEEYNESLIEKEDSVISLSVNVEILQSQLKSLAESYGDLEKQLRNQIKEEQEKYTEALSSRSVLRFRTAGGKDILYFGETKDGKASGYGVGLWTDGSTYEGFWVNNMRNGTGTQEWKDGELYEGAYKNDRREGFGIYTWSNGEQYKGGWKNDLRQGKGIVFDKNGEPIQAGEFDNDRLKKRMRADEVFTEN